MIKRAFILLIAAGIYAMLKSKARQHVTHQTDRAADAQWASEGGANAPDTV